MEPRIISRPAAILPLFQGGPGSGSIWIMASSVAAPGSTGTCRGGNWHFGCLWVSVCQMIWYLYLQPSSPFQMGFVITWLFTFKEQPSDSLKEALNVSGFSSFQNYQISKFSKFMPLQNIVLLVLINGIWLNVDPCVLDQRFFFSVISQRAGVWRWTWSL